MNSSRPAFAHARAASLRSSFRGYSSQNLRNPGDSSTRTGRFSGADMFFSLGSMTVKDGSGATSFTLSCRRLHPFVSSVAPFCSAIGATVAPFPVGMGETVAPFLDSRHACLTGSLSSTMRYSVVANRPPRPFFSTTRTPTLLSSSSPYCTERSDRPRSQET